MEKKDEENIEKIKLFSQLMGQEAPKEEELLKMMETAKKMQQLFATEQTSPAEKTEKKEWKKEVFPRAKATLSQKEDITLFPKTKEENMIYASIPFLDKEYQKHLYVIVRLLEMKRVLQEDNTVALEARSRPREDVKSRRRGLLQALRPYLTAEERQSVDFIVKAMDMKNIMEWKDEIL